MHGLNLSIVPELDSGSAPSSTDPVLGRMRNLLPLSNPNDRFGANSTPAMLRDLMRKLAARIGREPFDETQENRRIPAGYTYLLQFIAHDMVSTSMSLAATSGRRFGFSNTRQQPLTLDTIYGGGPDVSPQAYEVSSASAQPGSNMPRTRFRTGRATDARGSLVDIGRAVPVDVSDLRAQGASVCPRTEALIADARNDDHALIAQVTGLFHRMHNYILDQIEAVRLPNTAPDAYRNFICARYLLTLIYRRIILQDVLPLLLDPSVVRHYLYDRRELITGENGDAIPVEFAHGAFRCGHAMVRDSYRVSSESLLPTSSALNISSRRSPNFVPLPEEWIVKWARFFKINDAICPNFSRPLQPNFSPIARSLYYFAPLIPSGSGQGDFPGLPNRDLVSSVYACLWSVPKLIDALRQRSQEIAAFLPAYEDDAASLDGWLRQRATPNGPAEGFGPGDVEAIVADPPLPFYVLYEAWRWHGGERLGPLGSIIIAETVLAAMNSYPLRVGNCTFDARQGCKPLAEDLERLGLPAATLAGIPEIDSFDELLRFMQERNLLQP